MLDWESYPIPGVTYGHNSHYLAPFAVFKLDPQKPDDQSSQINSSQAVLRCEYPTRPRSRVQSLGTISCEDREEKQLLHEENGTDVRNQALHENQLQSEKVESILGSNVVTSTERLSSHDSENSESATSSKKISKYNPNHVESGPG